MSKIITIIGTRPEIIRLSRILPKLDKTNKNILVHTGQNYDYELDKIFFDELNVQRARLLFGSKRFISRTISYNI